MKLSTIITLALVGGAVTLLFTTEKGREYRTTALDGAKKWGDKLRERAKEMSEDAAPAVKKAVKEAIA